MKEYWSDQHNEYPIPADLDLESVWNEIEDKRNKKKKRRRLAFILPFLAGSLFLIGWYALNDTSPISSIAKEIVAHNDEVLSEKVISDTTQQDVTPFVENNNTRIKQLINKSNSIKESIVTNPITHSNEKDVVVLNVQNTNPLSGQVSDANNKHPMRSLQAPLDQLVIPIVSLIVAGRKFKKLRFPKIEIPYSKEFYIGSRVMLGMAGRKFNASDAAPPSDQSYLDIRKEAETVLESYGMEWFLRGTLSPNIFYETGLNISNVTSKSRYQYQLESSQLIQGDSAIIIEHLDGSIEYEEGFSTQYKTETYNNIKYNHFWSVGLPVRLGYQKSIRQKWHLGISSGLIYNFNAYGNGYIISPNTDVDNFTSLSDAGYNINHLLQSTSQLTMSYRWKYHWSIEGGVNFTQDLNSRSNHLTISDKYHIISAQIGIAYKLK